METFPGFKIESCKHSRKFGKNIFRKLWKHSPIRLVLLHSEMSLDSSNVMLLRHTSWTFSLTGDQTDPRALDLHIFSLALVFKCGVTDLVEESLVQKLDKVLFYLCLNFWCSTIAIVVVQIHFRLDSVSVIYFYKRFNGQKKVSFLPYIISGSEWGLTDRREYMGPNLWKSVEQNDQFFNWWLRS